MTQNTVRLNTGERRILRSLAHSAKSLRSLTHSPDMNVADVQLAPITVQIYVRRLREMGFISGTEARYEATEAGLEYLDSIPQVAASVLICAASMKGLYRGTVWNIRAGGSDHEQWKSRGIGA